MGSVRVTSRNGRIMLVAVNSIRLTACVFTLVVVATLLVATSAHATVYSGAANDPRGDVRSDNAVFDDLRSFDVVNDQDDGRLTVAVTFWDTTPDPEQSYGPFFMLEASFGKYSNNTCEVMASMTYEQGDSGVEPPPTFIWGRYAEHGTTQARYDGETYVGTTVTFRGLIFFESDFDCVTNIRVDRDSAEPFCYGAGGTIACPRTPVPAVAPAAPRNVQATVVGSSVSLSWTAQRDANFSHFTIRRDTQANPDTATWLRVGGEYHGLGATDTPAHPGTYFYYVNQWDRDGRVSAKSSVVRAVIPARPSDPVPVRPSDPTREPPPQPSPTGDRSPSLPVAPRRGGHRQCRPTTRRDVAESVDAPEVDQPRASAPPDRGRATTRLQAGVQEPQPLSRGMSSQLACAADVPSVVAPPAQPVQRQSRRQTPRRQLRQHRRRPPAAELARRRCAAAASSLDGTAAAGGPGSGEPTSGTSADRSVDIALGRCRASPWTRLKKSGVSGSYKG